MRKFIEFCKAQPGFLLLLGGMIVYGGTKPPARQTVKLDPIKVDPNGITLKFSNEAGEPFEHKTVHVYIRDKDSPDAMFVERFTFHDVSGDERYIRGFFMDRNQDVKIMITDE